MWRSWPRDAWKIDVLILATWKKKGGMRVNRTVEVQDVCISGYICPEPPMHPVLFSRFSFPREACLLAPVSDPTISKSNVNNNGTIRKATGDGIAGRC